jgi:hypothetical protein
MQSFATKLRCAHAFGVTSWALLCFADLAAACLREGRHRSHLNYWASQVPGNQRRGRLTGQRITSRPEPVP